MLQLASGFGQLGDFLDNEGMEPVMVDVSPENVRWGRAHGTQGGIVADAGRLPFGDGSMDAVVSDHFICAGYMLTVVERDGALDAAKEREILGEARRVLRPGGILVLFDHSWASSQKEFMREHQIPPEFKVIHRDSFAFGVMFCEPPKLMTVLQRKGAREMEHPLLGALTDTLRDLRERLEDTSSSD